MPSQFRIQSAVIFAAALFFGQVFTGTDLTFALLCGAFVLLFATGFNLGGGMYFVAGSFIFFNATLTCILAFVVKVFLREPGQSNLLDPNGSMLRYCGGMTAMIAAAFFSARLRPKTALLAGSFQGETMKYAASGCLAVGVFIQLALVRQTAESGSLSSALGQINHFVQMAIILGTTYEINASKGKRSLNWIVVVSILWLFFFGAINFSKEGMFIGPVSYLIPAAALRFNFSWKQVTFWAVILYITLHYLVPFSQYGRSSRGENGTANQTAAIAFLLHPEETRKLFLADEEDRELDGAPHFYNNAQGLFDREVMLAVDDALMNLTDHGSVFGLAPVYSNFANIVPHVIWANKPEVIGGNEFGRELGIISSDDLTTGISFSPTGDAYHEAGWIGILVVEPIVLFLLFFICDSVAGDTRKAPWNLLLIALASHAAPEGMLGGAIYVMSYGVLSVVIISLLSKYVLPYVSRLVVGQDRNRVQKSPEFRPATAPPRFSSTLPPREPAQPELPAASS